MYKSRQQVTYRKVQRWDLPITKKNRLNEIQSSRLALL